MCSTHNAIELHLTHYLREFYLICLPDCKKVKNKQEEY